MAPWLRERVHLSIAYRPGEHTPALDGLRGVAILLVLAIHGFYAIFRFGWMGVDLFFVLSGFLITGILIDSKGEPDSFRRFIFRRAVRIFPLYYGFLFALLVVIPAVSEAAAEQLAPTREHQWALWAYVPNWFFAFHTLPQEHYVGHFWSLAIEEQYYLVWPIVVMAVPLRRLAGVCIAMAIAVLSIRVVSADLGYPAHFQYMATVCRADALLIGGMVAVLVRTRRELLERWTWVVAVIAVVLLAAMFYREATFSHLAGHTRRFGFTLIAVLWACVLVASLSNGLVSRVARLRVLRFFGRYSYGLYVFHLPLYTFVLHHYNPFANKFAHDIVGRALASLATIGATIVLAMLSFHGFEQRFLRLKSRSRPTRRNQVRSES